MLWSFIAVCLSAWLSVDASYRGPTWQRWVFKPLTLLLLLLLAWQAPMFDAISYLVLAGLCASLLGDALTLKFTAAGQGQSAVKVTAAYVDTNTNAIELDAPAAIVLNGTTTITVNGYTVDKPPKQN